MCSLNWNHSILIWQSTIAHNGYVNLSPCLTIQKLQSDLEVWSRVNDTVDGYEQGERGRHKFFKTWTVWPSENFTTELMSLHI
jgi:hypothetical protein